MVETIGAPGKASQIWPSTASRRGSASRPSMRCRARRARVKLSATSGERTAVSDQWREDSGSGSEREGKSTQRRRRRRRRQSPLVAAVVKRHCKVRRRFGSAGQQRQRRREWHLPKALCQKHCATGIVNWHCAFTLCTVHCAKVLCQRAAKSSHLARWPRVLCEAPLLPNMMRRAGRPSRSCPTVAGTKFAQRKAGRLGSCKAAVRVRRRPHFADEQRVGRALLGHGCVGFLQTARHAVRGARQLGSRDTCMHIVYSP